MSTKKLTIVPLALPDSIAIASIKVLKQFNGFSKVFLQTEKHPCALIMEQFNIPYTSLDFIYDSALDFDDMNTKISELLLCDASGDNVMLAVPGRGIGNALFTSIQDRAKTLNTEIIALPSSGYAEAAAAAAKVPFSGGTICYANELPENINVYMPLYIEEIDSQIRAGEVKLALMEFYPEDCDCIFAYTNKSGEYSVRNIRLFELDRQKEFFATTTLLIRAFDFLELSRYGADGVIEITKRLRAENGCPWDIKQTHESLRTPLIEESYEVIDAIINNDTDSLMEELGDLFLQVVFHAQIEAEKSCFTMRDVATGLVKKLIYRHPHVFGTAMGINTSEDVLSAWEVLKKAEKHQETQTDVINSVPRSFPALLRSWKVQKKAANVGFDWDSAIEAMEKITEEKAELLEAMEKGEQSLIENELGDLIFSVVNVARLLKVDPEIALTASTDKFVKRFALMERLILDDNRQFSEMKLSEMDIYWNKAKQKLE